MTLELDEETPSLNVIKNMHPFDYRRLRQRWALRVLVALKGKRPSQPLESAFIVVTRRCSGQGLDWDNAYGGLKPLLDCLVTPTKRNPDGQSILVDDKLKHVPYPPYVQQVPLPRNAQGSTTVHLYSLPPAN